MEVPSSQQEMLEWRFLADFIKANQRFIIQSSQIGSYANISTERKSSSGQHIYIHWQLIKCSVCKKCIDSDHVGRGQEIPEQHQQH